MLRGWGEGLNKRMAGKGWSSWRAWPKAERGGLPELSSWAFPAPCCLSGPLDSADQLAGGLG